ncbi:MAG: stage V sporulation protein AE [Sporomusaceae bacterium]|nr:stage V sporulation protein AE [Sporomusaceae bacterium]
MPEKAKVILVTDGDSSSRSVMEAVAAELGLRCISASAGNPTPVSADRLIALFKQAPDRPLLVMVDDRGDPGKGKGERVMEQLAAHPDITVLGVLAVASDAAGQGARADFCINRQGEKQRSAVDKNGCPLPVDDGVIRGDTLSILDALRLPLVIGIGDIGKMNRADSVSQGAPVTRRAIMEILKRSDAFHGAGTENRKRS